MNAKPPVAAPRARLSIDDWVAEKLVESLDWALRRIRTSLDIGEHYAKAEEVLRLAKNAAPSGGNSIDLAVGDTPRTDACHDVLRNTDGGQVTYVDVEFARQLERELKTVQRLLGDGMKRIRELEGDLS